MTAWYNENILTIKMRPDVNIFFYNLSIKEAMWEI